MYFEKLSKKLSKEESEKLFISNFVKNVNTSIHKITSQECVSIKNEWISRLKNIDSTFETEVKKIFKTNNIKTTQDFYYKLSDIRDENIITDKKIQNIQDINTAPITMNNFFFNLIYNNSPETILILNHFYYKKYTFDFLRTCIDLKVEPRKEFIKLYKYTHFVNIESLLGKKKYEKINIFYNNM